MFSLRVRPQAASGDTRLFSFDKSRVTIGRVEANDITLNNRRRAVSRRHAEIRRMNGQYHLADLGSMNITRLNGQYLDRTHSPVLRDGDQIYVGDYELEFVVSEGQHDGASSDASAWLGTAPELSTVSISLLR